MAPRRRPALRLSLALLGALAFFGCPGEDPGVALLVDAQRHYMAASFSASQIVDFPTPVGPKTLTFDITKIEGRIRKRNASLRPPHSPSEERIVRSRTELSSTDVLGLMEILEDFLVTDPTLFRQNYRAQTLRIESFAGQECRLVEVTHVRPGRPRYHAWISTQRRFVLGVKELDAQGAQVLFSRYDNIVWDPSVPPNWQSSEIPSRAGLDLAEVARAVGLPSLRLPDPPPGWLAAPRATVILGEEGRPAAALRFDDGLYLGGITLIERTAAVPFGPSLPERLNEALKDETDPGRREQLQREVIQKIKKKILDGQVATRGQMVAVADSFAGFEAVQVHTPTIGVMALGRLPSQELVDFLQLIPLQ
jgi:hypothetical protein